MISLTKLAEPSSLKRNKTKWTEDLLDAIRSGEKMRITSARRKYNQPDVKDQLKRETNEKCAYCESKVTVVAYGDIEHVTPKSIKPELTFEWGNLTFACEKCNGNKSDKEGILDPYTDRVEDALFFVGPFLKGRCETAQLTEMELKLNRTALIEDRVEHLKALSEMLEKVATHSKPHLRKLAYQTIESDLESRKPEYIAMKRAALQLFGAP